MVATARATSAPLPVAPLGAHDVAPLSKPCTWLADLQ
jgi:hypothetical protein